MKLVSLNTLIASLMLCVSIHSNAADAATDAYAQAEGDFITAQPISLADLAQYGDFSKSNFITPTTSEITTVAGIFSYYVVNVVEDASAADQPAQLLVQNYPLLSGPTTAQKVIRADNTMSVEDLFNNTNLNCYDFSKLSTALVSQDTKDGVVLTNKQADFYKPGCTPKYDSIVTTIRQSDLFLITKLVYTKGATVQTVYTYGWKTN